MHLILTHSNNDSVAATPDLFRLALTDPVMAPLVLEDLAAVSGPGPKHPATILLPEDWRQELHHPQSNVAYHNGHYSFEKLSGKKCQDCQWVTISNGRYINSVDTSLVNRLLTTVNYDVAAFHVTPTLSANYEKMILTSRGNVAGFCRSYSDSIMPAKTPADWPHYLFVRRKIFETVFDDGIMPLDIREFYARILAKTSNTRSFRIGGSSLNLNQPQEMLGFMTSRLQSLSRKPGLISDNTGSTASLPPSVRIYGRVLIGDNVRIGSDVVIVGPAVLSDNVTVGDGAAIKSAVVAAGTTLPPNAHLQNTILTASHRHHSAAPARTSVGTVEHGAAGRNHQNTYRQWPLLSYPRLFKRLFDITASLGILIVLSPILPVIALAVKLSSPGPAVFKHKRQGLHGQDFDCLKFRTMIPGADNIQNKLRVKNQVDGPQFMMEDDPRVTGAGRFLRDTYLDELPQFINVLKGQMSMIGPRPSPDKENALCPTWHDARLSVRPGMSGLWQMERTRQPGKDFQEWIHYDTEYVRNLSFKLDLQIFTKTIIKIASKFFSKF